MLVRLQSRALLITPYITRSYFFAFPVSIVISIIIYCIYYGFFVKLLYYSTQFRTFFEKAIETMTTQKKRGPKADYAIYNGRIIEGLYCQRYKDSRIKNFYYINEKDKRISCTANINTAIHRYQDYLDKSGQSNFSEVDEESRTIPIGKYGGIVTDDYVSDDFIINRFLTLLKTKPHYIAKKTGIPQFEHMEDIQPIPQSMSVNDVLGMYLNFKRDKNKRYLIEVKRYYKEFCVVIDKYRVRDISFNDLSKYNNYIHSTSKDLKNQGATISNKFGAVHAVVNFVKKKVEYKKDLENILKYMEQLDRLPPLISAFNPITPKEFKQLLHYAKDDLLMTACLWLGLNCALRWTDIINIEKKDFDLNNKTFKSFRHKLKQKNEVIACYLWKQTVQAIRNYIDRYPNNTEYLFTTKYKQPYKNTEDLRKRIVKYRNKVNKNIVHPLLRKSFATIASRYGYGSQTDDYKTVMGRKIPGADNAYIAKLPENTKKITKAVYDYYFGSK